MVKSERDFILPSQVRFNANPEPGWLRLLLYHIAGRHKPHPHPLLDLLNCSTVPGYHQRGIKESFQEQCGTHTDTVSIVWATVGRLYYEDGHW
jgi:hypothetical protein